MRKRALEIDDPPARLGYRMPAEWEPHRATWIAWPHHVPDWEGKMATVHWDYVEIVRHLSRGEQVCILVRDRALGDRARRMLERGGVSLERVEFHHVPTNRGWLRDSGPIFLRRRRASRDLRLPDLIATDFHFNGWAKYSNWRQDDRVARRVARLRGVPLVVPRRAPSSSGRRARPRRIVLEGGSIDVNGAGLMLTTEECLLSPVQERNPGFTRDGMERVFADFLGVRKTLWLGKGIAGDDTHGHVDDLARFVDERTIVTAFEDDPDDENHAPLVENYRRLRGMTNEKGERLRIVKLPMPRPVWFDDMRLPASYANFYIANHAVLIPTFNDPADRVALSTLARVFPGRDVVGIHAVNLVVGLGTLHCLTQQEPG